MSEPVGEIRFSVLIPAYNARATISAALDSALAQSVLPHEILVFDDGSTDETARILGSYASRVRVFDGPNRGVARARNILCSAATGDHVAFLDADDIWHPRYLEAQRQLIAQHPDAVAYFTHHLDFTGAAFQGWHRETAMLPVTGELIDPKSFLRRYNRTPLQFQMSCMCMPSDALARVGDQPFYERASGAEDTYLHNALPLLGEVAHTGAPLVAYRIQSGSLSSDRLGVSTLVVDALNALASSYAHGAPRDLSRTFATVTASRKRNCGKFLMGAGRIGDARRQFLDALRGCAQPASLLKSSALLALTFLPRGLQPGWPSPSRPLTP